MPTVLKPFANRRKELVEVAPLRCFIPSLLPLSHEVIVDIGLLFQQSHDFIAVSYAKKITLHVL